MIENQVCLIYFSTHADNKLLPHVCSLIHITRGDIAGAIDHMERRGEFYDYDNGTITIVEV